MKSSRKFLLLFSLMFSIQLLNQSSAHAEDAEPADSQSDLGDPKDPAYQDRFNKTDEFMVHGLDRAIDNIVLCHNTTVYIQQDEQYAENKEGFDNFFVALSAAPAVIDASSWLIRKLKSPTAKAFLNDKSTNAFKKNPPVIEEATQVEATAGRIGSLKKMGLKVFQVGKGVLTDLMQWVFLATGELASEDLGELKSSRVRHCWSEKVLLDNPNWLFGLSKVDMKSYAQGRYEYYAYGTYKTASLRDKASIKIAAAIHREEKRCLQLAGSKVDPFDPVYNNESGKISEAIAAEHLNWNTPALITDRNTQQRVIPHPEQILNSEYMDYLGCSTDEMARSGCPQVEFSVFWQNVKQADAEYGNQLSK